MTINIDDCRSEVKEFAVAMEKVLRQNDHKGGWKGENLFFLHYKLIEEVGEFFSNQTHSIENDERIHWTELSKEIIDVANICMMLWDNTRERGKYTPKEVIEDEKS